MPNDIVLIVALLLPAAVLVALRIDAAMVFLSLCLGQVLVEFVAKDTDSLISFVAPNTGSTSGSTLYLIMLLLPVVLTCITMLFSIHGKLKAAVNVLPALCSGALLLLLAAPLFTPGLRDGIYALSFWQQLSDAQAMIIGAGAFISLFLLWARRRHTAHSSHAKHAE